MELANHLIPAVDEVLAHEMCTAALESAWDVTLAEAEILAIRLYLRCRHRVVDNIDPDTGEPTEPLPGVDDLPGADLIGVPDELGAPDEPPTTEVRSMSEERER